MLFRSSARFSAVAAEYSKTPQVTSTRVYLEAMELILPRLKKLIVDTNSNLDLSVIGRQDSTTPPANAGGAAQR